jgi:hypothetical protein
MDSTSLGSRLRALLGGRITGPPRSANGASSFHLFWSLPPSAPLVEVSVVLEVLTAPTVNKLYFWALQVEFTGDDRDVEGRTGLERSRGGGHTGLQWHPAYSGSTAVNWGGYASKEEGGGILPGSASVLPGFADEPNTRAYPWLSGRPYRLRVMRLPKRAGAWRAEVEDLAAARVTVVRDLFAGGAHLASPMVWSEVFADCDAPSVRVRWSRMEALDTTGRLVVPQGVVVNYQSGADGGCANTDSVLDGDGVLQVTNTRRTSPAGSLLRLTDRD